MTEDYKAETVPLFIRKFQIPNGNTGEVVISDPLLDSDERAEERAMSEFLKKSYSLRVVRFETHLSNFTKNQTINIWGLAYLVKGINTSISKVSIKTNIRAIRYE